MIRRCVAPVTQRTFFPLIYTSGTDKQIIQTRRRLKRLHNSLGVGGAVDTCFMSHLPYFYEPQVKDTDIRVFIKLEWIWDSASNSFFMIAVGEGALLQAHLRAHLLFHNRLRRASQWEQSVNINASCAHHCSCSASRWWQWRWHPAMMKNLRG